MAVYADFLHRNGNFRIVFAKFFSPCTLGLCGIRTQLFQIIRRDNHICCAFARNRVVLETAVHGTQRIRILFVQLIQEASEQDIGIRSALVNFRARMTAAQTVNLDRDAQTFLDAPHHRNRAGYRCAARTAREQNAFFLRINIEQTTAADLSQINGCRAEHANFFINGQNDFERRMLDAGIVENCQCIRDSNAVIAAQRRLICPNPFAIGLKAQTLFLHIQITVRCFLAHHIQMSLQNNRLGVFHARRRRCK